VFVLYVSTSEPLFSSSVSVGFSFADLKFGGERGSVGGKICELGDWGALSRNVPSNPNEAVASGHGEAIAK